MRRSPTDRMLESLGNLFREATVPGGGFLSDQPPRRPLDVRLGAPVSAYENVEAIFKEKQIIARVCVNDIQVTNWGLSLYIDPIPTPGLLAELRLGEFVSSIPPPGIVPIVRTHLSCRSDFLSITPTNGPSKIWGAMYVGWTLYFDPEVIRAMMEMGADFTEDEDWKVRHKKLSELLFDAYR